MVTNAAERRRDRTQRATGVFGRQADAGLDALGLLDLAWHDCYGEPAPAEQTLEDVWAVADGELARFFSAAHLAVIDFRDLRMGAEQLRRRS